MLKCTLVNVFEASITVQKGSMSPTPICALVVSFELQIWVGMADRSIDDPPDFGPISLVLMLGCMDEIDRYCTLWTLWT